MSFTVFRSLGESAAELLDKDGIPRVEQQTFFEADVRYKGQGLTMPLSVDVAKLEQRGLDWWVTRAAPSPP
jgi:5-oxoprolinase (ATP-hydrolysing)